ncbi:cysteine desulfurase [Burkholderia pseudomallei]|nr:cysteine desulfurase [Burkholderia pseudomallei]PNX32170.1 cysteine desulfurase [Burkholderia pseudomallei]RAP88075.1 cysteine desulfurase [Burkholderia pseudomallei]RAP89528.1 cysteine desulfurase [Burkholderia pseudomallei]RAP91152.1 cysteine desulfurase [Burkholderia pseudomallei]
MPAPRRIVALAHPSPIEKDAEAVSRVIPTVNSSGPPRRSNTHPRD